MTQTSRFISLTVDDTIVFQSAAYFTKRKDAKNAAMAGFAAARVCEELGRSSQTLQYYHQTIAWATKANDMLLNGHIHNNIGRILYLQGA